jgi:cbb3-type cytochrome oxidase maturation protein
MSAIYLLIIVSFAEALVFLLAFLWTVKSGQLDKEVSFVMKTPKHMHLSFMAETYTPVKVVTTVTLK